MATRLSAADVLSLHTQKFNTPADTITLAIIDASDRLSHQRLHALVAASLPQLARFRSRLVTKPLGVGQPVWAEIEDYDPSSQIHCATVRPPGGRRELADLVANLSTARRDSHDLLWDAWSIDGLAGGRWALAVKTSPALDDGAGGTTSWWPRLLAAGPNAGPGRGLPTEPGLGSAPSMGELISDSVTEIVETQVTGMWLITDTVSGVLQAVSGWLLRKRARDPMTPKTSPTSGPVPRTVFNAPLTRRRAVAFASIPLDDAKRVSDAFGGSVTNVVLAACTLSLRTWLQQHDKVPDNPLLMQMPFELPANDVRRSGRALTVGQMRIPVHLDDPVQILANLHTATERLNAVRGEETQSGLPPIDVAAMASLIPPAVARLGMEIYGRSGLRHQRKPRGHGFVSYIAGESVPMYCAGAKVVGMHTLAPLSDGSGLSIALTSRGDELDVTVCACPDSVPAIDEIATGIVDAVEILLAAAQKSPRGQGRSVVTEMTGHLANRPRGRPY